jgi:hypothetical protein
MSIRTSFAFVIAFVCFSAMAQGTVLFESALNTQTDNSGSGIGPTAFPGAGFEVPAGTQWNLTGVGGHIRNDGQGNFLIFGAIVSLSGPNQPPMGDPFNGGEVIASATFQPTLTMSDQVMPLSISLTPGSYAVVLGSGLFGATGTANMASTTGTYLAGSRMHYNGEWNNYPTTALPMGADVDVWRFIIEGNAVPVPEPAALFVLGAIGLVTLSSRSARL